MHSSFLTHQQAYVCSVCLSIFCAFAPECATCGTPARPPKGSQPQQSKKKVATAAAEAAASAGGGGGGGGSL